MDIEYYQLLSCIKTLKYKEKKYGIILAVAKLNPETLFDNFQDPTEFGTFMSALKCVKCRGYILPEDGFCTTTCKETKWRCSQCSFYTTEEKVACLLISINNNITKLSS